MEIPIAQLVPGDVVLLAAGDLIPADCRLLEAKDFFINQSLLTGESYPVEKHARELPAPVDDLNQADNAVFMGTSVISGMARAMVCRTGADTAVGDIADSLAVKPPPTAFELGTQSFGMLIMRLTFMLVLFVFLINAFFHRPLLDSFLFAIALAVGLTPELLPMVVTVTLSRGALRMAKKQVIVKQLSAIHNLGSMDVLCTDKTGTLTEGRIKLERHLDAHGNDSAQVLQLAYLNSFFETGLKSPLDDAILEHREIDASSWRKIDEVPFDFERRRVSVLVDQGQREDDKQRLLVVKGSPEDILGLSTQYAVGETLEAQSTGRTGARIHPDFARQPRPRGVQGARHRLADGGTGSSACRGRRRDRADLRRLRRVPRSAQGERGACAQSAGGGQCPGQDRDRRQRTGHPLCVRQTGHAGDWVC